MRQWFEAGFSQITHRTAEDEFVAAPGRLFVGADYSQVELRLLAHLSGDAELTRGFLAGEDIHAVTASGVKSSLGVAMAGENEYDPYKD